MTEQENFYVVSYDIADPRRLHKVAKLMENYGQRVLKSVFECFFTHRVLLEMIGEVEKIIDHEEDSVRIYFLCKKDRENILIFGEAGEVSVFSEDDHKLIF